MTTKTMPKIWIDLDNSPHVPFFLPIIDELQKRGCSVLLTARDCSNVCDLLEFFKLKCRVIGRHYGRHKVVKVASTCFRALQLMRTAITEKPDLAVSHGSRSQLLACSLLGIPSITVYDYEFASLSLSKVLRRLGRNWLMAPEIIAHANGNGGHDNFLSYPGIKEDVYVPWFKPDARIKPQLGLLDEELVVTVRPPANEAHYYNPESDRLFTAAMEVLTARPDTKIVLLPRNEKQGADLRKRWGTAFASKKIIIPDAAVDGLNLIWHSDLVISGGGTMNREAAALSVPVYSVFRGRIGAVDQYLSDNQRLVLIENIADVKNKIVLKRRGQAEKLPVGSLDALNRVVANIMVVLKYHGSYCYQRSI